MTLYLVSQSFLTQCHCAHKLMIASMVPTTWWQYDSKLLNIFMFLTFSFKMHKKNLWKKRKSLFDS